MLESERTLDIELDPRPEPGAPAKDGARSEAPPGAEPSAPIPGKPTPGPGAPAHADGDGGKPASAADARPTGAPADAKPADGEPPPTELATADTGRTNRSGDGKDAG